MLIKVNNKIGYNDQSTKYSSMFDKTTLGQLCASTCRTALLFKTLPEYLKLLVHSISILFIFTGDLFWIWLLTFIDTPNL